MIATQPTWKKLREHFDEQAKYFQMTNLFNSDPNRFNNLSINLDNGFMLFDYSKNLVDDKTMGLLLELASESQVEQARDAMFSGQAINTSEGRAVLHTALRNPETEPGIFAQGAGGSDGQNVLPMVHAELAKMEKIAEAIRNGSWTGHTGKAITDVVNIGIGGSDLGPVMAVEALKAYSTERLRFHFVSNIDGTHIANALAAVQSPETTLFIVVSKTFTTAETMKNAQTAKDWLVSALGAEAIPRHFVAVSTNHAAVNQFGIAKENVVGFWDWVGGRYSLWSAVGLSIMMAIGPEDFRKFLDGAYFMDSHFKNAPLKENVPVIMALLGIWYGEFWDSQTHAVLPYEQYLHRFPAYLQQADMESNGKSIRKDGRQVVQTTGPIVWGEPGTNGQHAFYQLIHQGTKLIPADFIAGVNPVIGAGQASIDHECHHRMLLANFFAQTEALMTGKTPDQVTAELKINGTPTAEQAALIAQKTFPGNRPSNTILYRCLDPFTLGSLIALYEHKIFVQGVIWGINSFDQWGVELGKQLANVILKELDQGQLSCPHDQSTSGLLQHYFNIQN